MDKAIKYKSDTNVKFSERIVSLLAGSLLVVNAFERKSFSFSKAAVGGFLLYRGVTGHCPLNKWTEHISIPSAKNVNIRTSLTVNRPRHEVYNFWRKLSNLPLFMKHLESVEESGNGRSHWKLKIPGGFGSVGWDAEIVKEEPDNLLGWSSVPGAAIESAGKLVFNVNGENATKVDIVISYRAPLGIAGETVAKLFTPAFEKLVKEDISNFIHYMEKDTSFAGE